MTEQEIYGVLEDVFRDVFDDPGIKLTATMSSADIPDWDSFNNMNIIMGIEMKLGVRFTTADVERMSNVSDLVHAIAEKLN